MNSNCIQNRVSRLRDPFDAHCVSHWNETAYNVSTDQQYSMSKDIMKSATAFIQPWSKMELTTRREDQLATSHPMPQVELAFALGYDAEVVVRLFDARSDVIKKTIQENLVQANVYYETLNVRSVTQTAKYSSDTFVASLGGALGLYMGMAVIMMFEVVELVFDIAFSIWKNQQSAVSRKI
ncbi:unnamed protein product [Sphagnum tenellum]